MTVDATTYRETDTFVQPRRTFFPTKIPQQHYQLKNYISTVDKDIVYYASRSQIFAIHTPTRKRQRIVTLSWLPQCLGAGFGWICVGGPDKGRCAFINIGHGLSVSPIAQPNARHAVEVDALLPLDLDPHSRILAQNFLGPYDEDARFPWQRAKVDYHELGGAIVNSITVHKLQSSEEGLEDEIVAIIANNDQTVRIFSLSQSRLLQTLEFPTHMNHATISPNGKLLVASGDVPRAFFWRRNGLPSPAIENELGYAKYEWQEIAKPKLTAAMSSDSCFTTAFSPSGHICAVASQAGLVTIFDTSLIEENIEDDAAVLNAFSSSRPSHDDSAILVGAIRSMAFGPQPWDLLAWAEDQGRVCVTDLRNNFSSRQTIDLNMSALGVDKAELVDVDDEYTAAEQRELEIEARFIQRHREALDAQDHLAAVSHAADYMELAAERRRLQRDSDDAVRSPILDTSLHGLSEGERQVLESLRIERQRHAERGLGTQESNDHPFSVHYLQPSRTRDGEFPSAISAAATYTTRIQQYIQERNFERNSERAPPPNLRAYEPRRRSSVVMSNNNPIISSSSSHPTSLAPVSTNSTSFSTSPSRIPAATTNISHVPPSPLPIVSNSIDPWQTISAAMGASGGIDTPLLSLADRIHLERLNEHNSVHEQDPRIERDRGAADHSVSNFERRIQATARLERLRITRSRQLQTHGEEAAYEDYELEMLRMMAGAGRRRASNGNGLTTMGIGWSADGRCLYAATEEGIFELIVNIQDRKTFPSLNFK